MKRLLYIAFHDKSNQLIGVQNKILSQCRAFEEYSYQVDLIQRQGPDTILISGHQQPQILRQHRSMVQNKSIRSVLDKQNQLRDIKAFIHGKVYDACYIRYDFSDPGFIDLLKAIRKSCPKIALELPTYPYEDENRAKLLSRVKLSVDIHFRKQLRKYVDFIVTFYSGYDSLFGVPVLVVPNGFDFSTMSLISQPLSDDTIHIIAVSSMREWHGYERFIEGLRNYRHSDLPVKRDIILHLVGNGREYGKYQQLAADCGLADCVIMEGSMHGKALDALYEKCALGIDSLARHRSGIDVLSSLKSREYGAKGIPMINSCAIDILGDDFPYLLRVPADEEPVDITSVIQFYDDCFAGKDRLTVAKEIRDYVEARSSMKQTLSLVIQKFQS